MARWMILAALILALAIATGCDEADVASRNVSDAADNFEVERRVVFLNGITDNYLLVIEGRCSIYEDQGTVAAQLEVTCKTGPNVYRKHFLGLSDNVTYLVEQIDDGTYSSEYHHKVRIRPKTLVPDLDVEVGGN